MSIGFVVVTYNSAGILSQCLKSIPQEYQIVVVDNASKDNSVEIAKSFNATVFRNETNVGFGAACNKGAKALSSSHALFLNPDAILTRDAVRQLETAIIKFPDAGGFAPRVHVADQENSFRSKSYIQEQGRRYLPNSHIPNDYAEVDFIDGASLLCDLNTFFSIGGFDEKLFLYFEDDDLCFRIRALNKRLIYVPYAVVLHKKRHLLREILD